MSSKHEIAKHYPYARDDTQGFVVGFVVVGLFILSATIVFFVQELNLLLSTETTSLVAEDWTEIAIGLASPIIALHTFLPLLNIWNDIKVTEDGLLVRVFLFRYIWRLVPWGEIVLVGPTSSKFWSIFPSWKITRITITYVQVKRLTYWHRWVGWWGGLGFKPAFAITELHRDSPELIAVIRSRVYEQTHARN